MTPEDEEFEKIRQEITHQHAMAHDHEERIAQDSCKDRMKSWKPGKKIVDMVHRIIKRGKP